MLHTGHDVRGDRLFLEAVEAGLFLFIGIRLPRETLQGQVVVATGGDRSRSYLVAEKRSSRSRGAFTDHPGAEIELKSSATSDARSAEPCSAVGVLILDRRLEPAGDGEVGAGRPWRAGAGADRVRRSALIGDRCRGCAFRFAVSRASGATISTGLLLGVSRVSAAERFSFALAVVLTPAAHRHRRRCVLLKPNIGACRSASEQARRCTSAHVARAGSIVGMVCSFLAGLLALRWLSRWLETGRWQWFGVYCLVAAGRRVLPGQPAGVLSVKTPRVRRRPSRRPPPSCGSVARPDDADFVRPRGELRRDVRQANPAHRLVGEEREKFLRLEVRHLADQEIARPVRASGVMSSGRPRSAE